MVCFAWQMSFDDLRDPDLTRADPRLSRESNRNKSDWAKMGSIRRVGGTKGGRRGDGRREIVGNKAQQANDGSLGIFKHIKH